MLGSAVESEVLTTEQSSELRYQQERLADWFAGFVDGEGTITFTVDWKRNLCSPYFQVCNTSNLAFEECKRFMDVFGIPHHIRTQKLNENWRVVWKITVGKFGPMLKLLTLLEPRLIVKKRQAQLVLDFVTQRFQQPMKGYTADQVEMMRQVKQLNQRSSSETSRLPFKVREDKVQPAPNSREFPISRA